VSVFGAFFGLVLGRSLPSGAAHNDFGAGKDHKRFDLPGALHIPYDHDSVREKNFGWVSIKFIFASFTNKMLLHVQ
jgi:hypothetical protein